MRIIEPLKVAVKPKKKWRRRLKAVAVLAVLIIVGVWAYDNLRSPDTNTSQKQVSSEENVVPPEQASEEEALPANAPGELRVFSGNEFRIFYDQLLQPNLDKVDIPPVISGNDTADNRIRKIAEARGYRLRSSPSVKLASQGGVVLQETAMQGWKALQVKAQKAGLGLSVASSYRSVETQRDLFLSRLGAAGATIAQVASGNADKVVDKVLITTSIPGYSKHHTGYTVDFLCAGYAFDNFEKSTCNKWLSDNNYQNAKESGFIPSYPPDAGIQGPNPEAWEYVYVGTDLLTY